jgi:hypothetical protein
MGGGCGAVGSQEYAKVLIRAIGISLLAKICADVCRGRFGKQSCGRRRMAARSLRFFFSASRLNKDIFAYATEILSLM